MHQQIRHHIISHSSLENNIQHYEITSMPNVIILSIMHFKNIKWLHIVDSGICLHKFTKFIYTLLAYSRL